MDRLNKYTCRRCGGSIITIDREEGVTPFMIGCRMPTSCIGTMESSFYLVKGSEPEPTFEWRKPTKAEYAKLDVATREQHVDRGGLLIYPIERAALAAVDSQDGEGEG